MKEKFLITSALPYANGPIHFGHIAGAYLPADCFARFQRLKKNDVLYICGSDEYGIAITLSAEIAKKTPKELVDIFHEKIFKFFEKMDFSFDHYSRTTWKGHAETVHEFFLDLCDNGYIEEKVENHLFSKKENKFLADRYVIGVCPKCGYEEARGDECQKCGASYEATDLKNPKSKLTKSSLVLKPSKHWYLRFDKFKDQLQEWISKKKWKPNVLKFAMQYIEDLKPRAITRDLYWGVPLPIESAEGKVLYVWFDAPIGYISATKEWAEKKKDKERWKDYWFDKNTKLIHFIGKDNIPFHAIFFPAMIMGQSKEYILPDQIPANEFLLLEGRQFSKSEGWYIDEKDFFSKYTSDQIRYYLAANAPENSDAEFSFSDFQVKCNAELLGKLGNFVNRVLVFSKNNLDGKAPSFENLDSEDEKFLKEIEKLCKKSEDCFENFHLRKASKVIMELSDLGNVYFDHKKPWKLVKTSKQKMKNTIFCALKCVKALSLISCPIIPKTAQKIWELLGYKNVLSKLFWDDVLKKDILENQKLKTEILFRKVEDSEIEEQKEKLYSKGKIVENFLKKEISFEDFEKLDFRVGKILEAEKLEKSKKLLKLQVDLGFEKRQIISGIANHFKPEDLIGKKVIVLINLKPMKFLGHESQGMILAGGDEFLEIPFIEKLEVGSFIR
jgi:methionyl-tRNA synthetase